MKNFLISVLIATLIPVTFAQDEWVLKMGVFRGRETVIRVLNTRPSLEEKATLPYLIAIVWRYTGEGSTKQMPNPSEIERMDAFEALIHEKLVKQGIAKPVIVLTGGFKRELLYYVSEPKKFVELFNKAMIAQPRMPIEINSQHDSDWGVFNAFSANSKMPQ
jgi:Family of unknown function (DUF695)